MFLHLSNVNLIFIKDKYVEIIQNYSFYSPVFTSFLKKTILI